MFAIVKSSFGIRICRYFKKGELTEKYFKFDKHETNYKRDTCGLQLLRWHILAVNPQVLSLAGVDGVSENMKMDQVQSL